MELPKSHIIKSLVFDLSFDEERKAAELYNKVRDLHYNKVERIISDCLDEFVEPHKHLFLPRLELDLGAIPYQMMETELELKLTQLLRKKLKALLWEGHDHEISEELKIQDPLESLQHYLNFGFLPWNEKSTVEDLLEICLEEKMHKLPLLINHWIEKPGMMERLLSRSSEKQLGRIIHLYGPSGSSSILKTQAYWVKSLMANALVKEDQRKLRREITHLILCYLHRLGNSPFDPDEFDHALELLICEKYKLSLHKLAKASASTDHGETLSSTVDFFFEKSSLPDIKPEELGNQILQFLSQHPAKLRRWIYRLSSPEPGIKKIVRETKPEVPVRLLKVLEPGHHEKIDTYRESILELNLKDRIVQASQLEFSLALWEIILLILVKKGNSRFNLKAFLLDLLEKTERKFQLESGALLYSMYQMTLQNESSLLSHPSIIGLIGEIYHEQEVKFIEGDHLPQNQSQDVWEVILKYTETKNWHPLEILLNKEAQKGTYALTNLIADAERRFHLGKGELLERLYQLVSENVIVSAPNSAWKGLKKEIYLKEESNSSFQTNGTKGKTLDLSEAIDWMSRDESWEELVELLREEARKGKLELVLLEKMKVKVLKKVLNEIHPHESGRIIRYTHTLLELNQHNKWILEESRQLEKIILSLAARLLLQDRGSASNQKYFLKRLIKEVALHYGLEVQSFLIQLREASRKLESPEIIKAGFYLLLEEIFEEEVPGNDPNKTDNETHTVELGGDVGQFDAYKVRNQYREGRIRKEALLAWIMKSEKADVFDLLHKLLPEMSTFIKQFIGLFEAFVEERGILSRKNPQRKNIYLQAIILALEVESWTRRDWLKQMIRRMATELAADEIKLSLDFGTAIQNKKSDQVPISERKQLVELLKEISSSTINPSTNKNSGRTFSVNAIAYLIFGNGQAKVSTWGEFGFRDEEEALEFMLVHFSEEFFQQGSKYSIEKIEKRLSKIPVARLRYLFGKTWGNRSRVAQDLMRDIQRILHTKGYPRQVNLLGLLESKLLAVLINGKKTSRKDMLKALEEVLEEHGMLDLVNYSRPIEFKKAEVKAERDIFISNAGLAIFNAYLGLFFDRCGLTNAGGFVSKKASHRAVNLLQHIVFPGKEGAEEELALNKLICGLPIQEVVDANFVPSKNEQEVVNGMFNAIINHWDSVKNSTIEGFRESWLWREGKLTDMEKRWTLVVEQKPYDILLDYKPFSITPLRYSWMNKPIWVEWR